MYIAGKENNHLVLSFERGEELFFGLKQFFVDQNIVAGTFSGLGAADKLELAYYNFETREYERHTIEEDVEILSLQGNIAWKTQPSSDSGEAQDELILHIHGVFGKRDLSTFGGHLFSLRASGVCEIHLVTLQEKMTRALDEKTGLNTLCSL